MLTKLQQIKSSQHKKPKNLKQRFLPHQRSDNEQENLNNKKTQYIWKTLFPTSEIYIRQGTGGQNYPHSHTTRINS